MGYTSDIVAVFYTTSNPKDKKAHKRNEAKLKLFMKENFPQEWVKPEWANNDEGLTMLENDTGTIYEFQVTSVKWYESFEGVKKFDEFWDRFVALADGEGEDDESKDDDQEPPQWACEFIRLGENDDDVETKSSDNAEYVLQVNRTIDRNY